MKKRNLIIIALALVILTLASCGKNDDSSKTDAYPPLTVNALTGNTATAETGNLRITYLKDDWTFNEGFEPFTLYYTDDIGNGSGAKNINVQNLGVMLRSLSEKDLEDLNKSLESQDLGFVSIKASELRGLNGKTVMYIEAVTEITDEAIDVLIKDGTFTEADIQALGGREAIKSLPSPTQFMVYAVVDKTLCIYTASYYDDADKQLMLDTVNFLVENTQSK